MCEDGQQHAALIHPGGSHSEAQEPRFASAQQRDGGEQRQHAGHGEIDVLPGGHEGVAVELTPILATTTAGTVASARALPTLRVIR